MSPDPYAPDYSKDMKEFDDYQLPSFHKCSLREIKKKIENKGYKELEEVDSHQEFLEDLANKVRVIIQNERRLGEVNWELDRQLGEIKNLYQELEKIRKELAAESR